MGDWPEAIVAEMRRGDSSLLITVPAYRTDPRMTPV
jgi:hypothetical protein